MSTLLETKPKPEIHIIEEKQLFDLIILGGGPAGLTAAIYALRSRLKTLLIEKMVYGGQAVTTFQIENYPGFPEGISGPELMQKMADQAQKLGLETLWGEVKKITKDKEHFTAEVDGKHYLSKAVIVATGSDPQKLDVPGEEKFRGRGVSYCATCDGAFYQGKNIIVVGGGNSAVEEALFLTRYAKKVTIVHRRDELRADKILAERAQSHPQIYFFWHSVVEEIKGDKMVSEVILKDLISGKKLVVPTDGIFVYIGAKPNSEMVKGLARRDEKGYILTDDNLETSTPGLFAAGDVRAKLLRQIVTAAGDGALAAEAARKFIESLK